MSIADDERPLIENGKIPHIEPKIYTDEEIKELTTKLRQFFVENGIPDSICAFLFKTKKGDEETVAIAAMIIGTNENRLCKMDNYLHEKIHNNFHNSMAAHHNGQLSPGMKQTISRLFGDEMVERVEEMIGSATRQEDDIIEHSPFPRDPEEKGH